MTESLIEMLELERDSYYCVEHKAELDLRQEQLDALSAQGPKP